MGVLLVDHGRGYVLRRCEPGHAYVAIQLRPSPNIALTTVDRPERISVGKEWLNLGLNLGGAALSWVGVVGSAAVAPETGGLSLSATVLLYSGATASSLQVANSVWRLVSIYTGHAQRVENADKIAIHTRASTALDVIGLVGAGAAAKETVATGRSLQEMGGSFREGLGALSRPQRLRYTQALELQSARRVAAARINLVLKLKLVDALGAIYGTGTSAYSGAIHDIVIFIIHPDGDGR